MKGIGECRQRLAAVRDHRHARPERQQVLLTDQLVDGVVVDHQYAPALYRRGDLGKVPLADGFLPPDPHRKPEAAAFAHLAFNVDLTTHQ